MENQFSRSELLLTKQSTARLATARVAVFGLGGVGGYVVEALARAGIGTLDLVDNDTVGITNLNRQIFALHSTLDMPKTEAARARVLDINPNSAVNVHNTFFLPENAAEFDFSAFDYVVDAIDTVSAKIELVMRCKQANTPIISAMGAGNKLSAVGFSVSDIYKTSACPLARVMRRELRARKVDNLKVVYSEEKPIQNAENSAAGENGKPLPGSVPFVPPIAGFTIAGEVIKDLLGI